MRSILILAGASGVGKTTLAMRLLDECESFSYVRSATTRAPRGDSHDDEYIYLTREDFLASAERGDMLEYMEYGGNLYGTPRRELDRIFEEGKTPLLVLDLEGVRSLRRLALDFSVFIFYIYGELNDIERRLYQRELAEAPTVEKLEGFARRKAANIRDYLSLAEMHAHFDAFIENRELDAAFAEIKSTYSRLLSGALPDREKNRSIALRLHQEAEKK